MCCFAGHVSDVTGTNIFARIDGDREYVVYEMTFTSNEETAMILPIPIAPGAAEGAVEFVALDDYPDFFRDLEAHFKRVWAETRLLGMGPQVALKVDLVGAFEASFVPRIDLLDRLDVRFRINPQVWNQLPAYASFGFVVFKLRPGQHVNVHPMAFSFRTSDPTTLFFPTVHVHDGTVHQEAAFDHIFYTQNQPKPGRPSPIAFWMPSVQQASRYVRVRSAHGLVDGNAQCFQASFAGAWKNQDMLVRI
jgi:hypothetical protein